MDVNHASCAADGLIALRAKRKGSPCQQDGDSQGAADIEIPSLPEGSPCQQDGDSQGAADIEIPSLPEDIWRLIHSLMPMRDAARAACVSHSFLSSWRCHPNLNFSSEALGLSKNAYGNEELAGLFYSKVNHILKRHSGIGVKKLTIKVYSDYSGKGSSYLNNWLQIAVKPGIEELIIALTQFQAKYNFPCSLLSNGSGDSIQYLHLSNCSFHPTVTLSGLRSLTRLYLCRVRITENELGCLLSHSLALEQLEIRYCNRIVCLKVPCLLQRLISLKVFGCDKLKLIENEAPNVSMFAFQGDKTELKLGETLQIKSLCMVRSGYVYHARAELPSIMPNLESLALKSCKEAHPALADSFTSMPVSLHLALVLLSMCEDIDTAAATLIITHQLHGSPCQQDGDSQGAADIEIPSLPEDIWRLIHSLMPMRDAARAACVSRSFLSSWRCHPNLNFSSEAFGLNKNACGKEELAGLFYSKVDHILKRHSGIGVKKLKIQIYSDYSGKGSSYLNNWLQISVKPGIEELIISLTQFQAKYNFPCSLLSNGSGDSIQYLHLSNCSFHPTVTLSGLRSLMRLYLCCVRITENELGCLLSHSLALEQLEIRYCDRIVCLKVPCLLQRLISLKVFGCDKLKLIENEAPNVSIFAFQGDKTELKLGETLQIKSLCMVRSGYVYHARAELPSIMPNLESLAIKSRKEV
uniref:F-box domain-containing protein n=1 Tax=Oryza rufipogon TaxID=4529 RepID=A0A0E0PT94_ORYRU